MDLSRGATSEWDSSSFFGPELVQRTYEFLPVGIELSAEVRRRILSQIRSTIVRDIVLLGEYCHT